MVIKKCDQSYILNGTENLDQIKLVCNRDQSPSKPIYIVEGTTDVLEPTCIHFCRSDEDCISPNVNLVEFLDITSVLYEKPSMALTFLYS